MNTLTEKDVKAGEIPSLLFTRTSVFTLSCTLAALTVFTLLRTLVTAFSAYPLNELKAVYYFFGNLEIAVGITNGICGGIVCAVLFLMTLGMMKAVSAAKIQDREKLMKATDLIKYALAAGIIITVVMIVCSFSSVSIMNYEYRKSTMSPYIGSYSSNAGSQFALTVLFGGIFLTLEIAQMRLLLAIQRCGRMDIPQKQGSVLSIIMASFGAVVTTITFIMALFDLVMPSAVSNTLSPVTLARDTLNVLLTAALSVLTISVVVVVSVYICMIEELKTKESTKIYQNLFSNAPPSPYKSYATPQNYDYNQPTNYPPYYDVNRAYNRVFRNIYENKVPPVPEKPVLSFKPETEIPHTQYPGETAVSLEKKTDNIKEEGEDD